MAGDRTELGDASWDIAALQQDYVPLTEAQVTEMERRLAAHRANPGSSVAWEIVVARLRAVR